MLPLRYILNRLLLQIFVLLGLSVFTFLLMFGLPGDPAASILMASGFSPDEELVSRFREHWGLDRPIYEQYFVYISRVLQGDLGDSMVTKRSIGEELRTYFPATVELALAATFLALVVGVPAGIISAVRRNSIIDHLVRVVSLVGNSMPIFWLAILALYVFYFKLGWVPSSQRIALSVAAPPTVTGLYLVDSLLNGDGRAFVSSLHHLILPAVILGLSVVGLLARITRASILEVLSEDYIRTARAKGISERLVLYRHALRNAMIPIITTMGLVVGSLLSGTVLTETIFSWPGIGRFAVQSIFALDRPTVMGVTLLIGVVYSLVNLGVDVLITFVDPRIRY